MTVGLTGIAHPSLAAMADALRHRISREALHLKFTANAVVFMAKCISCVLHQKINDLQVIETKLLRHFKRILIFDSTSWDIDPKLRTVFPGSGGRTHQSANCKVQLCYEYLQGVLSFFEITPGTNPDNKYAANLPQHMNPGDLLIADLGYFYLKSLQQLCCTGAFFLFRFMLNTALYDAQTEQPINLHDRLRHLKTAVFEMPVAMGLQKNTRVTCRLVCLRVNETVANERRRKLRKNAKRKGKTANKNHLFLAGWIIMVTNIPKQWLPAENVRIFYGVRWQIELIFKQMKSVLAIHQSATGNEHRLRCELIGKMIMAIIIHRIHAQENIALWNDQQQEISMEKLYKRIQERLFCFMRLLLDSIKKAVLFLATEIKRILPNCRKLKQKSRFTTLESLSYETRR
jgi:hypothetical protein